MAEQKGRREKFSYSKLETYCTCAFKYYLKYVLKQSAFVENINTAFGKAIHSCEEDIANCLKEHKPINYNELKGQLIYKLAEIEHKYPVDYNSADKSGRTFREKSYKYLKEDIYRLENLVKANPTYEIVGAEIPIKFEFDGEPFTGFIDRVIKDTATGKFIIQDIKTWSVPKGEEDLKTPLQFVVYAMAIINAYGCTIDDIECSYDLPICDVVQPAGTKGFYKRGIEKMQKLFTQIRAGEFKPNPNVLCYWCEYSLTNPNAPKDLKMLCPYFSHKTPNDNNWEKENEWQGMEMHQQILEMYQKQHQ